MTTATGWADTAQVLRAAGEFADAFAAGADERDAQHRLPHPEIEALAASGLLAVTVPERFGGLGLGAAGLARLVAVLAAADPSIAQIPQSHFTFLEALRRRGSERLQERIFGAVLSGAVLANAQTERGGATVTDDATTVRRDGDGLILHGTKYYCTGAAFADLLAVRAVVGDGPQRKVVVYLPVETPGVTVRDDWDALGQRTTSSGTVDFDEVRVGDDQLLDFTALLSQPSTYGARAQLLHAAIDTGLARGALRAGAGAAAAARPWFEAEVGRAADDPYLIAQAGELEVTVRSAEALLAAAAGSIDTADAGGRESADPAAVAEASLATAAARVAAGRAARDAGAAIFDFGGTRAAAGRAPLARYWRDARTHTLHDPERWKLHHLGRWALSGAPPPSHTSL